MSNATILLIIASAGNCNADERIFARPPETKQPDILRAGAPKTSSSHLQQPFRPTFPYEYAQATAFPNTGSRNLHVARPLQGARAAATPTSAKLQLSGVAGEEELEFREISHISTYPPADLLPRVARGGDDAGPTRHDRAAPSGNPYSDRPLSHDGHTPIISDSGSR